MIKLSALGTQSQITCEIRHRFVVYCRFCENHVINGCPQFYGDELFSGAPVVKLNVYALGSAILAELTAVVVTVYSV